MAARRTITEVPLRAGEPQGGNFGVLIHDGTAFASDPNEDRVFWIESTIRRRPRRTMDRVSGQGISDKHRQARRPPGIRSFDHVSLPLHNTDAMLAFYRSLGLTVIEGPRICSVHFGDQKINFHRPTHWAGPGVHQSRTRGTPTVRRFLRRVGRIARVTDRDARARRRRGDHRAGRTTRRSRWWERERHEPLRPRSGREPVGVHDLRPRALSGVTNTLACPPAGSGGGNCCRAPAPQRRRSDGRPHRCVVGERTGRDSNAEHSSEYRLSTLVRGNLPDSISAVVRDQ